MFGFPKYRQYTNTFAGFSAGCFKMKRQILLAVYVICVLAGNTASGESPISYDQSHPMF